MQAVFSTYPTYPSHLPGDAIFTLGCPALAPYQSLQVLFFTFPTREALLRHAPDPAVEFSLTDEMSFLFRMLATAGGAPCQAANLLRCLRQSKEAAALGLLEGVKGERVATGGLERALAWG